MTHFCDKNENNNKKNNKQAHKSKNKSLLTFCLVKSLSRLATERQLALEANKPCAITSAPGDLNLSLRS